MTEQDAKDMDLARMAEDDHLELGAELEGLLTVARRGRGSLSPTESVDLMRGVMARIEERRRRLPSWRVAGWAAALAAGAILAALFWPRSPSRPPTVVKQVYFETVSQGKVSRLEITLTRKDVSDE